MFGHLKKGLLSNTSEHDSSEISDDDDLDTEQHLPSPSTNTSIYYTSQAWKTTITNATNAVKQSTNANRVQTLLQPARQPSQTFQDQPSDQTPEGRATSSVFISALLTLDISIPVTMHHHFSNLKIWHNLQFREGVEAVLVLLEP